MHYILNLCNLITVTNVNKIMLLKLQMQNQVKIMFCTRLIECLSCLSLAKLNDYPRQHVNNMHFNVF